MRDLALAAIRDVADDPAHIGAFLSEASVDDVWVVRFISLHPGYVGWHWSTALVATAGSYTVNEVWMEPGEGALPIPEWKPWSERVRPGDLGAGDVVPTDPADVRITPGYTGEDLDADDLQLVPEHWQPGLGRARVLSVEGLTDAAERWRSGDDGPESQVARLADFPCSTCAWLLPIGGLLGQAFGVCAHDMSPSDGHIVAMDHGCGAHSDVRIQGSPIPVTDMLVDDNSYLPIHIDRSSPTADDLDRGDAEAGAEATGEAEPTVDRTPDGTETPDGTAEGSVLHSSPATDDVAYAEESDDDAREGDVAPPQAVVGAEDIAEQQAEQGE